MTEHSFAKAIVVEGLSKSYRSGGTTVRPLQQLSFTVAPAQFAAVVGPSGSGKSTLLNLLAGLDAPDSGRIVIGGDDITKLSQEQLARKRLHDIGIVFQFFNLLPTLTIEQNVTVPAQLKRTPRRKQRERVRELLSAVGILPLAQRFPHEVSGGEVQRAAIARALVNAPACVLADEPTGNLDSEAAAGIVKLFRKLTDAHGITLLVVTHDKTLSSSADRLLQLDQGTLRS